MRGKGEEKEKPDWRRAAQVQDRSNLEIFLMREQVEQVMRFMIRREPGPGVLMHFHSISIFDGMMGWDAVVH